MRSILMLLGLAACGDADTTPSDDTDLGADTDDPGPGESQSFGNGPEAGTCSSGEGVLYPFDDEHGEWAATVIQVRADTRITAVEYVLVGDESFPSGACDPTLAHALELWIGTQGAPAASPDVAVHVDVPIGNHEARRVVRVELPTPLDVANGESVVAAVQMNGAAGGPMCLGWCDATNTGTSWWSYATAPPYSWTSLGTPGDLAVTLYGE